MIESLPTEGDSRDTLPLTHSAVGLLPGSKIDRYVVLSRLGAGGMGVVLSAYDPELDRKVALKVLHAQAGGRDSREARRLVREAMAMARLNHPNVITVHDVGEHEGRVFISMELVEGQTLRQRLHAESWGWERVLDVFIAAGRGLAYAHAKGLIHRDFKPDNVMIGDEQRIRVMDFGLARDANDSGATFAAGEVVVAPRTDALAGDLTHAGKIVGTPGYMAPEQHRGDPADAKSDQFAFCVALYEALFGRRPFEGDSALEVAASIVDGRVRSVPAGHDVPVWVRRIVLRGLSVDATRRWPSMDALLDALGERRARQRTRRWSAIALATVIGGASVLAGTLLDRRNEVRRCEEEGAAIATSWNEDVSAELRASVTADAPIYADAAYEHAVPWLDDYARQWQRIRTEACVATRVEDRRSADLEARSFACLDERRLVFDSLVHQLSTGGTPMAFAAVEAASGLPALAPCMDDTDLARDRRDVAVEGADVVEIREALADAAALQLAARYPEAVDLTREALRRAIAVESIALEIEARLRLANQLVHTGEVEAAAEQAEQAFFLAGRIGDDSDAAEAASTAASTLGFDLRRVEDGLEWARLAEMALARLGEEDTPRVGRCRMDIGQAYFGAGDYDRAQALYESALAIFEREVGPDHPRIADVNVQLGLVAVERGEFSEAERYHTRALGIAERAYGLEHPSIAKSLNNIAVTLDSRGQHARALELYERALELWTRVHGDAHPKVARTLLNIALVHYQTGNYDEAIATGKRGIVALEQAVGPDHPDIADGLDNLMNFMASTGDFDAAAQYNARALAIRVKAFPAGHSDIARSLTQGGLLAAARPDIDEKALEQARADLERAMRIWESTVGSGHPDTAFTLNALGIILVRQGHPESALDPLEQAMKIRNSPETPKQSRAESEFELAKVLRLLRREPVRARDLATDALAVYREGGEMFAPQQADIEAWLSEGAKPKPR